MTATLPTAPAVQYETMIHALRTHAERRPDAIAYSFVNYPDPQDPHGETTSLTFHEMDRAARAFAATLQPIAEPGERAVLLLPPGLDYVKAFFGCLYAGIIAVPLFPPSTHNANGRLDAVCTDADPACLITTDDDMARVTSWLDASPTDSTRLIVSTGEVDDAFAATWDWPDVDPEQSALLQYTSGSTRTPAGVMVPHRGLLANGRQVYDTLGRVGLGKDDDLAFVSWLPLFHDMGLMVGVVLPIIAGHQVVQLSASSFLRRPERWLQAISDAPQQTFAAAPNLGYELCAERITADQRARLDLSRWRYGLAGAEPVRVATVHKFREAFAPCGLSESTLCAGYGLAESTLIVSVNWETRGGIRILTVDREELAKGVVAVTDSDGAEVVGAGSAVPGTTIAIVDPETRELLPEGRLGEVWVTGPAIANGYYNRPEETEAAFRARLSPPDGTHYLRTGDIGFLHDGELYLTTRLKDLIIVDGRNFYPPDLEDTAEQAHALVLPGRCSAFAVTEGDREKIVVLVEARLQVGTEEGAATAAELRKAVRQAIFDVHEVGVHEVVLVAPGAIPRTSSGKIQRSASRQAYLDQSLRVLRAK
ncbi:fatty acyl-AMP ligase [Nocardia terpenica]|uniref:fatty acyl-AMP ligase n=1 Tax=Nocardia terpenica TaxID=455432 RepID=UPI00031A4D9C|nr:fatty acyl-AMP ligase [Nocardia terpenica]NQE85756.1 fatty acyl-AMP ligase [Nocardia terpenica]